MPKICYREKNFRAESLLIITQANGIIEEYAQQGYLLTLRQLFYQFVSRDLVPNTQKSYSRVGSIINDARLAGLIDWDAIEDRTRNMVKNSHWVSPGDIIKSAASSYAIDKWENQEYRVEVWVEKEALSGIFERICRSLDVPFFACRGYVSQSEMWRAAQRLRSWERAGYKTVVLHFGDHDPSGIDMTRDILVRLRLFETRTEVRRLALTWEQVRQYSPPPNFAKETDARFANYRAEFGDESWELDALEPRVLRDLVQDGVFDYRDPDLWGELYTKEQAQRDQLKEVSRRWPEALEKLDLLGEQDTPTTFDWDDEEAEKDQADDDEEDSEG